MSLDARHYRAINFLAQPDRGGLTLEQVAKECGVTLRTIHNWKNDPAFSRELKKTIIRYTQDDLPKVMKAMVKSATEDRNAAMVKLILQMNDMLPSGSDTVDDRLGGKASVNDIEDMQKRIEEFRSRKNNVVKMKQ
ncbi:phBC6A51 family helix-turn-helix protein [Lentibacillus saliphilus]|uniref:phBC6A51 family helix-turn-helix protein n=1 Tax=Lentibacillus saliphilus TaxID=2737028 RepID=UPI001C310E7B|nr:phBC6A51 family helix-turn-helix protein [Lentibacillus saliphilus]